MSKREPLIVVDANVWLDNYLGCEDGACPASVFIQSAHSSGAKLLYPVGVLKDVFYVIGRRLKSDARERKGRITDGDARAIQRIAWACVDNMRELGTAVGMDESDLWLACKYRNLDPDLEDNLVVAAAERVHADYIVTSDEQLIRKSRVAAFTPGDMTAYLEAHGR